LQTLDRNFATLLSEKILIRILLRIILQLDITASFFFRHFSEIYVVDFSRLFRLRQRSIERLMDITDSFTWEDLPNRDADTGQLSAAGWVPLIKMYSTRVAIVAAVFHFVQSTILIVTNQETALTVWYPFDWTVSPFYELVNISQVTISTN